MLHLNTLSNEQKVQIRNAFTLIDSDSRDSKITMTDLVNVHKTLGLPVPPNSTLEEMLGGEPVSFAQFSQIMAREFAQLDDRTIIYNALEVFAKDGDLNNVNVEELKEACCSVQLGEIGSGDNRFSRSSFDTLTKGFVKEQMDGTRLFCANKWLEAYID